MRFKFEGHSVEVTDGKLICGDKATVAVLSPFLDAPNSFGPQDGDPFTAMIREVFGNGSVTDYVDDGDPLFIN